MVPQIHHHLLLLVFASVVSISGADEISQYLTSHNRARAAVGVGPLRWSPTLASRAQTLVRQRKQNFKCQMFSAQDERWSKPYGANQAYNVLNMKEAVDLWVSEGKYYDYKTNTCTKGNSCGAYTQVVWRKSQEIGCALASCGNPVPTIAICLYNPPGNYVGQKPY